MCFFITIYLEFCICIYRIIAASTHNQISLQFCSSQFAYDPLSRRSLKASVKRNNSKEETKREKRGKNPEIQFLQKWLFTLRMRTQLFVAPGNHHGAPVDNESV